MSRSCNSPTDDNLRLVADHFQQQLPGRQKIWLKEMYEALDLIERQTRGIAIDRRDLLSAVLSILHDEYGYTLPKDRPGNYDGYMQPRLPKWVIKPSKDKREKGVDPVWVPELAELGSVKNKSGAWVVVNDWLKKTRQLDLEDIPVKERSFEIFGDEKLLEEKILQSKPVQKGIVSKDIFRIYPTAEPIKYVSFSKGKPCIVIENRDTFHSFWRANNKAELYSVIAYGCGNSFLTTWQDLDRVCCEHECPYIEYFGDIDSEGINIPFKVYAKTLFPLSLQAYCYKYLIEDVNKDNRQTTVACKNVDNYIAFLPYELKTELLDLLYSGYKIPQEAMPYPKILDFLSMNV